MKLVILAKPKGLPKREPRVVTVQPDVRLSYPKWVLHHRIANCKCF